MCVWSDVKVAKAALTVFLPAPPVKPDPPSDVSVRQEVGQETRLMVTWRPPPTWNPEGKYYQLMYEMKYKPISPSAYHEQVCAGRQAVELPCFCFFDF